MNLDVFCQQGKFLMLALDHRSSFLKLVGNDEKEASKYKRKIIESTYPYFSSLLIDPVYGLKAYKQFLKDTGVQPKPFLLCLEKTGYVTVDEGRKTEIEYSPEDLKKMGASGAKLLLYINTSHPTFESQLKIAQKMIIGCKRAGLPIFLEIVLYEYQNKIETVIQTLKIFIKKKIIPDVFKIDFPGSGEACKQVTSICPVPWIILSRGSSFHIFDHNLSVASQNGCSGFLGGRSLWQDFPTVLDINKFFRQTLPIRFSRINRHFVLE